MKKKFDKIAINLPCELNKKYKEMANTLGVPKTYLIITALNQYLDTKEAISILSKYIEKTEKAEKEGE